MTPAILTAVALAAAWPAWILAGMVAGTVSPGGAELILQGGLTILLMGPLAALLDSPHAAPTEPDAHG